MALEQVNTMICDRCGARGVFNPGPPRNWEKFTRKSFGPSGGGSEDHLCAACCQAFDAWMDAGRRK